MRAEDLAVSELVEFAEGFVGLGGRRLILHDLHAFAQFRKDLVEMAGLGQARRILTRFGYITGREDAAAMKRLFRWDTVEEWLKAGPRLQSLQGISKNAIRRLKLRQDTGEFEMEIAAYNSSEAQERLLEIGPSDHPACWSLTGYWSGYASQCLGSDVIFIEKKCRAQGDQLCVATGKSRVSWGREVQPYAKDYELTSISDKVQRLSQELRQKSRQLARQRRDIQELQLALHPGLVEVRSKALCQVLALAQQVARYNTSVLIRGETGVGKEVLARYIHRASKRSQGSFVAVNCSALPETLLESELFGHRAGAFTGAMESRTGIFEHAESGTILLDEIADISLSTQAKLLRVLQEREVLRLGENRPRKIDIRVLSATNQDLDQAVREGRFREDLLYRLKVVEIVIPPLRERAEDLPPLARHFVQRLAKRFGRPKLRVDASCWDYLMSYSWPGNVRELENVLERAAVLTRGEVILPESLPQAVLQEDRSSFHGSNLWERSLSEVEANHIRMVLRQTNGNQTRAARILNISPSTLWRKLKTMEELDAKEGRLRRSS